MADQATIDKYKSWLHEKKRGDYFAHTNYAGDCQEVADYMAALYPELAGQDCACSQCQANVFTA